jgi:hypothetical protein
MSVARKSLLVGIGYNSLSIPHHYDYGALKYDVIRLNNDFRVEIEKRYCEGSISSPEPAFFSVSTEKREALVATDF